MFPIIGIHSKGDFTSNKPAKEPLASCSLVSLDFLPPQTT